MKHRTVIWKPVDYQGIEYLTLRERDTGVEIESVVVGVENQTAFRVDYHLKCDPAYSVREVALRVTDRGQLHLTADERGRWFDGDGQRLAEFDACLDIDIVATPFTNTLPIRRIKWQPGQTETLNMVYISIPQMTLQVDQQRYTYVEKTANGELYRFEQLSTGFTVLLPVDRDGLVIDYPELFSRVWSG
jgi:uncharacterized protein